MPIPVWLVYGAVAGVLAGALTRPKDNGSHPPTEDPETDHAALQARIDEISAKLDAAEKRVGVSPDRIESLESDLKDTRTELAGLRAGAEARSRPVPTSTPDDKSSSTNPPEGDEETEETGEDRESEE